MLRNSFGIYNNEKQINKNPNLQLVRVKTQVVLVLLLNCPDLLVICITVKEEPFDYAVYTLN